MKNIYILLLLLSTLSCTNNQPNIESVIVSDAENEDLIVLVEWSINEGAEVNLEEWNDAWSKMIVETEPLTTCLLYTSPSPRDKRQSRMPSSA